MSRGRSRFGAGLAFLGLAALFSWTGLASPALTTSSDPAAGTDDRAPGPVANLEVVANLTDFQAEMSWKPSPDDFIRPSPTGTDFTSGGTFVNVNDVAGYTIWRSAPGGVFEQIASLGSGESSYIDSTVESGVVYVYAVTASDAAGNESESVESGEVTFGPPGEIEPEFPPGTPTPTTVLTLSFENDVDVEDEEALDAFLEDFRALLADLLGIDISRIVIKEVRSGSVVVDFEITEDEADPAADVVDRLTETVTQDPAIFADAGLGTLLEYQAASSTSVDFGEVEADGEGIEEFSFTNTSTDPDAVLIISASVEGTGYFAFPEKLTLGSGESGSVEVSFAAVEVGNVNGSYPGTLTLITNDPNNGLLSVALSATVVGGLEGPSIDVSPASLAFSRVTVGSSSTRELTIRNNGGLPLETIISLDGDDAFSLSEEGAISLEGGESLILEVTFAPMAEDTYSATISISSNDPVRPELEVALSGVGSPVGGPPVLRDEFGNEIFGDFDGNAAVNFEDFFLFADNFGLNSSSPNFDAAYDLSGDGAVNFEDFFIFADNFGKSGTYEEGTEEATEMTFSAILDESQVVGGTGSAGSGGGSFTLSADHTSLTYEITVVGIPTISAAHFHNAPAGVSAGVVRALSFEDLGGGVWVTSGTWSSTDASQPLSSDRLEELLAGELYVNVHTPDFGGGEIRGQVLPGISFSAFIDESQANAGAGTGSEATGDGFFSYSDEEGLSYVITVRDITPSLAHIHGIAPAGVSAGVVHPLILTEVETGVWMATGTWDSSTDLTPALVDALKAGELYVNFHTAAFGQGEIRGQIE